MLSIRTSRSVRAATALTFGAALTLTGVAQAGTVPIAPTGTAPTAPDYKAECPEHVAGHMHCDAYVRTDVKSHLQAPGSGPVAAASISGYGPSQLQSAYNLAGAAASKGAGETVAVVDAFNDPAAAADLAVYRSQYGLPSCTADNGCLKIVSQTGSATSLPSDDAANDDWSGEVSLDLDMVSATCPLCGIDLVEANSDSDVDLGVAVDEAVALGAKYISNSYGSTEYSTETTQDRSYYNHPGVVITASSGDSGYVVEYPAASAYVTAVGGTKLSTDSSSRGWAESVWSNSSAAGTGSGCSAYEAQPTWQTSLGLSGCANRIVADVSAVADPNTGVAVYDSDLNNGGWNVYGGTSAASPLIASVYALAGAPGAKDTPAQYPYTHPSALHDVTSGSTATCTPSYLCTAQTGYDGPTGLGTPDGTAAFAASGS
jgi:subtilase family serine protease